MKIFQASLFSLLVTSNIYAATFDLPPTNDDLIGAIQITTLGPGENITAISKEFDIGYNSIELANPQIDFNKSVSSGSSIKLTTQHILPNLARVGIIINLPEMRMYYYPRNENIVYTYPIGIGKMGKTIPITRTSIIRKMVNPEWRPTPDIRAFNLERGIVLPQVMPPGPDNPLGQYAIYMRVPTYLIHSTIFPESIGKRASFGCIRMFEDDIQLFFPSITGGIPVAIINAPTKIGWENNFLYIQVYPPLEEHRNAADANLHGVTHALAEHAAQHPAIIDWQALSYIMEDRDGVPHEIGVRIN